MLEDISPSLAISSFWVVWMYRIRMMHIAMGKPIVEIKLIMSFISMISSLLNEPGCLADQAPSEGLHLMIPGIHLSGSFMLYHHLIKLSNYSRNIPVSSSLFTSSCSVEYPGISILTSEHMTYDPAASVDNVRVL